MSTASGSHVRLSIVTWSVYLVAVGLMLLVMPSTFFDLFGLDGPPDSWVRITGVVALVLSAYYMGAAIHKARWLYWYSVPVRIVSGFGFAALAVVEDLWQLWIFAAADIASSAWTFVALRWKPEPEPLEPTAAD